IVKVLPVPALASRTTVPVGSSPQTSNDGTESTTGRVAEEAVIARSLIDHLGGQQRRPHPPSERAEARRLVEPALVPTGWRGDQLVQRRLRTPGQFMLPVVLLAEVAGPVLGRLLQRELRRPVPAAEPGVPEGRLGEQRERFPESAVVQVDQLGEHGPGLLRVEGSEARAPGSLVAAAPADGDGLPALLWMSGT